MDFSQPHLGIFFYRFVMVVRKNVLEYIIALVVVKNKERLKKCLKKINTKISTSFRRSMLISFWIDVPGGRAHPVPAPTLKLEKLWFFWRKIVIFHTKYPNNFPTSLRPAQFFLTAPPNLKSWIRPYWPQYVHYQCHSRRWIQNWSVWDICFKWLKLC